MSPLLNSLNVALVGMVVVFIALVLIIFSIKLFSAIFTRTQSNKPNGINSNSNGKADKENTPPAAGSNVSASDTLSPELIAVITAAIAASMQSSASGIRVKSIKRIGHTTPIWNIAGRNEYILSKL